MKQRWKRVVEILGSIFQVADVEQMRRRREINESVERVVEQVNPRLRAVGGYRKTLTPVVLGAQEYIRELVAQVPGPVLVDSKTWATDPFVNALFDGVEGMRWILSGPEVRKYLNENPGGSECFAVIAAYPDVKRQLGVDLVGDAVHKDVPQTTVSFRDHEVGVVGDTEARVRRSLESEALDILVSVALEEVLEQESRVGELLERLRVVRLKRKIAESRGRAAGRFFDDTPDLVDETNRLIARAEELEKALEGERAGIATLDEYLTRVTELLARPETHLGLERVKVHLDRMNILREGPDKKGGVEIEFARGRRRDRLARVISIIRFPRSEVLDDAFRLREIERHLG